VQFIAYRHIVIESQNVGHLAYILAYLSRHIGTNVYFQLEKQRQHQLRQGWWVGRPAAGMTSVVVSCMRVFDASYRYCPFQVECSLTGNHDALTGIPAPQLPTPFRNLKSVKVLLAQDR
jgi:hypothetical protein